MAGLSDNASIILRIKADSTAAVKDLNKVQSEIKGVGTAGTTAAGGLTSMINPAALAAAGITVLATAAAAAVVGLFNLTKASAEFGSEIFDAKEKTGLSAATLSTLKVAADNAGSSLEQVTSSTAKFAKTLGEARDGNEKAQANLKELGVTTYDLDAALAQATSTIYKAKEGTDQMVLAQKAFGRGGAELLPVIKQLGGDLAAATKEAERLGLTLSEKDIEAADNFGDALGLLSAQAKAAGVAFTSDLMVVLTDFFQKSTQWYANNQDEVRAWGAEIGHIARGIVVSFNYVSNNIRSSLEQIAMAMGANAAASKGWAEVIIANAWRIVASLNPILQILYLLGVIGKANPQLAQMSGEFSPPPAMPRGVAAGGGGGGGSVGKDNAEAEAEKQRQKEVRAAELAVRNTLQIYKKGYEEQKALFDTQLLHEEISTKEHIRETGRLRIDAVRDELRQTESLLTNDKIKLNDEEKAEILQKIKVLTIELRIERIKAADDITEAIKKEVKAENEALEVEKKRLQAIKERRGEANKEAIDKRFQDLKNRTEDSTMRSGGFSGGLLASVGLMKGIDLIGTASEIARQKAAAAANGIKASWGSMRDSVMNGIDAMVQGLGSMVESWVLYGSVGPNAIKKMVAATLAGVAAQASVLAIFELAKGFAALFFNPAEAAAHFTAAALFGSIAVASAVGGRKLAGDSFSQSTANGGAGGGANNTQGDGAAQRDPNSFTSGQFGGFGSNGNQQNSGVIGRLNETLVVLEDTVHGLKTRIAAFSPGQVLGMGAEQNPNAISDSLLSGLSDNPRLTGGFKRAMGDAR